MNRRSLTFRLVSWYCGLLLVLGGVFATFAYVSFDRYVEQADRRTLAIRADAIWSMAAGLLDGKPALADLPALTDLMERRFAPEAQSRFIRISSGGAVLYRSGDPAGHEFDPASVPLPNGDASPRLTRVGDLILYVKSFAGPDGRRLTVETGRSADQVVMAERRLVLLLMFALPLLLVFAAGGGYALVRRALGPVESMIQAAEALTFNSPRNRLPLAGTGDRIDALGRTLNRMLERLDGAYRQASRFSADAAHELRTPLAIMRGELELLAAQPAVPDPMRRAIANILGEAVRLSLIVDSLIAMSHMESVSGKRAHRPVDLCALARETIDQIRLLADEKNIAIEGPSGAPAIAAGDRDRLKQVLVNLLDNAIKYTDAGGRISVRTLESGDVAVLEVADTGVGIAAEHLPHIFNRFFRVDTDRGEIGAGLGLAIVRSICAAHGGRIEVESLPGRGSIFRVSLPRATEALILGDAAADEATTASRVRISPAPDRA